MSLRTQLRMLEQAAVEQLRQVRRISSRLERLIARQDSPKAGISRQSNFRSTQQERDLSLLARFSRLL